MADNQSMVAGLFSTPEQYQQAQLAQQQANAVTMAQLTPEQRATAGMRVAGYQIGSGIGGALGAQDPMLQQVTAVNNVMKQINFNDPQSMMKAAIQLQEVAPQQAAKLAADARAANEQLAKTSAEGITGKAIIAGKYTPESLAKFDKSRNAADLEAIDLSAKPSAEWLALAKESGLKAGKSFNDYTPEEVGRVNELLQKRQVSKAAATASVQRIDLGSALEKVYLSKDREEAAKSWAAAGDAYKATTQTLASLDTFEQTAKSGFTGATADAKLALSKAMGAFGVPIGPRASDTEISNALSSTLVQQIAKVFPGSQSNKELGELLKSKPNISQELPTILRLINKMRLELKAKNITYEQGAALSDTERTSFNPNLAEGKNFGKLTRYDALTKKYNDKTITDAERAEAKKIQAELKLD
jgi:hypothetical protein